MLHKLYLYGVIEAFKFNPRFVVSHNSNGKSVSVETIFKVILHPFINESLASLKSMTQLEGQAGDIFIDNVEDFRFKGYAVCSDIQGSIDGVVLMHHYSETAVAIGNSVCESMLGEKHDHQQMNEQLSKALAEWGNTIIGRATNLLSKHSLGFDFLSPHCALSMDDMEKYLIDKYCKLDQKE